LKGSPLCAVISASFAMLATSKEKLIQQSERTKKKPGDEHRAKDKEVEYMYSINSQQTSQRCK